MKHIYLFLWLVFFGPALHAQICGTPGLDGPVNVSSSINTYFPVQGEVVLPAGAKSILLAPVPATDPYENNFGLRPISAGDMLLIIQMQDATINYSNDNTYGANSANSGSDGLGGTGYTDIGNSGKFEYVIATNAVPLSGGILTFKGMGTAKGVVNTYINAAASPGRGTRTFQVVRIPQYSNLTLTEDIKTPPFNGKAGGIIAFDVSGTMNFNGFQIDASARGFRGGYAPPNGGDRNIAELYVTNSTDYRSSGKGEGVAGTPRYMWDGFNQVDGQAEGLPGGSYGKGAPANAGGGGNVHNAGGGGGGNGGSGGVGGNGVSSAGITSGFVPNGGRPGSANYDRLNPDLGRLLMGGGGGAGHADNARDGVKGGVGGGIVLINVGRITGTGKILSNGSNGRIGVFGNNPDGAGGGGAGGTVIVKVTNPDPAAVLTIEAMGGNGGNTFTHSGNPHGPGGGAGGGEVFHSLPVSSATVNVGKGKAGSLETGRYNKAEDGQDGYVIPFSVSALPAYLQGGGITCYPELSTVMTRIGPAGIAYPGEEVVYQVKTSNYSSGGNAGGVQIGVQLPAGFVYSSATVAYTGDAGGPISINNSGTDPSRPLFGDFNISPGDAVLVTIRAKITCNIPEGTYHSNAQAQYLDPTRTIADVNRRITPLISAFLDSNTNYETGSGGSVSGSNYNGSLSTAEDVTVGVPGVSNNVIKAPLNALLCNSGDPDLMEGGTIVTALSNYSYQWQLSADGLNFQDIPGAVTKDYNPDAIRQTTYYRRGIVYLGCIMTQAMSNVVKINVITPINTADFEFSDICLKDGSAKFINKTEVTDGVDTPLSYLWDYGDPGSPNPTSIERDGYHVYTHAGEYMTRMTVFRSGGCEYTVTKTFRVNGSVPKADFTVQNSTALCSGREILFEDKARVDFGELTRIDWYYDDLNNPTAVETDHNPGLRNAAPRIYRHLYPVFRSPASKVFMVRMVAYSGLSCVDERIIAVTLQAVPEVVFDSLPSVCSSVPPFQLIQGREVGSVLSGKGVYSGTGVSATGLFDPGVSGVGKHTLSYSFLADNGCSSEVKTQEIVVFGAPTADAGNDQVILAGGEVKLRATATAAAGLILSYKWTPSLGLSRDDVPDPVASPLADMTYKLTVSTNQGCTATDDVFVDVLANPGIPSAFSPNGDGINDEWNIKYLSSYPSVEISIYNRYGEKVFRSTGNVKSWDGKYKGLMVPVGTYYYIIDPRNGRKAISGSVTILR